LAAVSQTGRATQFADLDLDLEIILASHKIKYEESYSC